jgi:hypothetical protein
MGINMIHRHIGSHNLNVSVVLLLFSVCNIVTAISLCLFGEYATPVVSSTNIEAWDYDIRGRGSFAWVKEAGALSSPLTSI